MWYTEPAEHSQRSSCCLVVRNCSGEEGPVHLTAYSTVGQIVSTLQCCQCILIPPLLPSTEISESQLISNLFVCLPVERLT